MLGTVIAGDLGASIRVDLHLPTDMGMIVGSLDVCGCTVADGLDDLTVQITMTWGVNADRCRFLRTGKIAQVCGEERAQPSCPASRTRR